MHELSTWRSVAPPTPDCTAAAWMASRSEALTPNPGSTESTCATNASCDANGSASQILSSTEHPSARSAFDTPESTAGTGGPNFTRSSGDQPFGHASSATGMTSETLAPPAIDAVLVTD